MVKYKPVNPKTTSLSYGYATYFVGSDGCLMNLPADVGKKLVFEGLVKEASVPTKRKPTVTRTSVKSKKDGDED